MTYVANFFAKYSVDHWNRCRPLRKICRCLYQGMSAIHIVFARPVRYPFHISELRPSFTNMRGDTYPWPYCEWDFAHWPESDVTGAYTLVSDPAGFVVHHSTSYCAWKIRERTGQWPKKRQPGVIYHAKNWQTFLAENGYTTVGSWAESAFKNYVAIDPDYGEFGQVYWYEGPRLEKTEGNPIVCTGCTCSTYEGRTYRQVFFDFEAAKKLIWIMIR